MPNTSFSPQPATPGTSSGSESSVRIADALHDIEVLELTPSNHEIFPIPAVDSVVEPRSIARGSVPLVVVGGETVASQSKDVHVAGRARHVSAVVTHLRREAIDQRVREQGLRRVA